MLARLVMPLTPSIPSPLKREMQALLHQQMWCWGQDVLCRRGNLLVDYGMTRFGRPDNETIGSNRYQWTSGGVTLWLWAFAAVWRTSVGTVMFDRFTKGPRVLASSWMPDGVHRADQFPPAHRPTLPHERSVALRAAIGLSLWISDYEQHVLTTLGACYRTSSLTRWEHPIVPGPQLAKAWRDLAASLKVKPSILTPPHRGSGSDGVTRRVPWNLSRTAGRLY